MNTENNTDNNNPEIDDLPGDQDLGEEQGNEKENEIEFKNRGLKIIQLKDEKNKMQVELDRLKAVQKKLDDDEKKKKGDYDSLISEKQAEIDETKRLLEEANTYKEKLEAIETETKKELLSRMSKSQRTEWENEPLDIIRKFVKSLPANPDKLDVDTGGAGETKDVKLNESQKKLAVQMFPSFSEDKAVKEYIKVLEFRESRKVKV